MFRSFLSLPVKPVLAAAAAMLALTVPVMPAQAQFSDSYNFLKAVKDADGAEATKILDEANGNPAIIDDREARTGEGALHIVIKRRDARWTGFLLQRGLNPNVADRSGNTPLILATQLNFPEGADWLLRYKANVDQSNRSGETPLILAVQLRYAELVRALLAKGANPDKTDNVAGLSARDYAKRDSRAADIVALIEANDKKQGKAAPDSKGDSGDLDFSGIGAGPIQ
ncbi:ankyrin repeat domain-containing protein [Sphingorhabdus arenilitoris]|uniref:Ankyrin repeat domain-containing protein n=1 Tax=Sphingorhabdus arenilitoris TaxID=1490041 RepID=A0ABV8RM04_9SPHN